MAAEYYEANGFISGDTGSPNTVSGTSGKDRLVSGNDDGSANTGFQRFYGGDGSDSTIRARDFDADTALTVTKHIADFQGAASWSATNNDFISFVGFGKDHEGQTLSLVLTKQFDVDPGDERMLYTYEIHAGNETLGTILVNSLNGEKLGTGDYAFYG